MSSTLTRVLELIARSREPLSVARMARELEVAPGALEGMID